eukprot:1627028-Pleurochrysis_carterae.AAC.1
MHASRPPEVATTQNCVERHRPRHALDRLPVRCARSQESVIPSRWAPPCCAQQWRPRYVRSRRSSPRPALRSSPRPARPRQRDPRGRPRRSRPTHSNPQRRPPPFPRQSPRAVSPPAQMAPPCRASQTRWP